MKNFALDLALTVPWATTHFLNDENLKNITYTALVIDKNSNEIKQHIGNKGTLQTNSANMAIKKLEKFAQREKHRLLARNVKIEVRAYGFLPVIHGFLVNDNDLYFSFTKMQGEVVEIEKIPYLYITRNSETSSRFFSVYNSWFDYTWESGRTVFIFDEGSISTSY